MRGLRSVIKTWREWTYNMVHDIKLKSEWHSEISFIQYFSWLKIRYSHVFSLHRSDPILRFRVSSSSWGRIKRRLRKLVSSSSIMKFRELIHSIASHSTEVQLAYLATIVVSNMEKYYPKFPWGLLDIFFLMWRLTWLIPAIAKIAE